MDSSQQSTVIICLGGSLISTKEGLATSFLKRFKQALEPYLENGMRFALICGGGQTARTYQSAMQEMSEADDDAIDWIGIEATHLNAMLVRSVFDEYAPKELVSNPTDAEKFNEQVIVGAGWKPGWSTDYIAVLTAKTCGAKDIATLSNIDYVYDKDPKEHSDAQKITDITWVDFREQLIPSEWVPGAKSPFDPVASKEAQEQSIRVAMMNGTELNNFDAYLQGGEFKGTWIHN